jgi:branched-chain amino acid transport system ATP-binding protein
MSWRGAIPASTIVAVVSLLILRGDGYQLYIITLVGLTAIVGTGLNVLLGLSGQISLGHVAFYAIGGYTVGILTTRLDWSFWPSLAASGLIAGLAGVLLAVPALRVRGSYLAMVTIAFGFVVEQGAAEWSGLTGGWNGLMGIPSPLLFGFDFGERGIAFLTLALTLLSLIAYARLSGSPWGKAMRAVRDSEPASLSIGLDPTLIRTTAFGISAIAAGIAGGVNASISNFISPESFPFSQSIVFLLVVMLGGADRVLGPLVGACVVVLLPELLSALGAYRLLFVGVLLLLVLRLAPTGLVGLFAGMFRKATSSEAPKMTADIVGFLTSGSIGGGISVNDLSVGFGGVHAVRNVSFNARAGEITSIIGPNGAGKSTVLNLICGFYRPDSGTVWLRETNITEMRPYQIPRAGIARTYQTSQLFATMSVFDNVLIALRRGRLGAHSILTPDRDPERRRIAEGLLAFVGYTGGMHQPADALSHVDRRFVEIARALAIRPGVLALDEPAAGLDAKDTAAIGRLLRRLAEVGIAVILVEHDMELVMGVSTHVVVLDAGAKIAEGLPAAVAAEASVREAYLGDQRSIDRGRRRARPAAAATLLSVEKLSAGYGAATVVREADLDVAEGEVVAVLGSNGAGKSTMMKAISGLIRLTDGKVLFLGERVERLAADRIAQHGLILVPEGRQIFPELSVLDNLRLGAYARRSADQESMVGRLLDRFPALRAREHQPAGLLSGGEQQMLAIARGMMARPRVLMLDEPSLGLAPKLLENLYDLLAELREEGTTILLVDQMAALALSVADRAYVLQSGAIKQSGTASEIGKDPALMRAYLGEHGIAV